MNAIPARNQGAGHCADVLLHRSPGDELLASLPNVGPIDALSILAAHPELCGEKSVLLDIVYEEFCRRVEQGESVEPRAFAARFPAVCRSFLRLIEVHQLVHGADPASVLATKITWPAAGEPWLDFDLLEELGRGAFSRVYLARDRILGNRLVVIKATPLGPREAEMLGSLRHLHVVPIYSMQRDDHLGLTAVCMPYLSRVSLFDVIEQIFSASALPARYSMVLTAIQQLNSCRAGQMPEDDSGMMCSPGWTYLDGILQIGVQLTEALSHAHRLGVLHCDVKPSNVLMTSRGRAILIDFNLSRSPDGTLPFVGGTLPYMAPEQLTELLSPESSCAPGLDFHTDVYSLGATLFELAYGRAPFGDLPMHESRRAVAGELLERQRRGVMIPEAGTIAIDGRVAAIIARCLEFEPAKRPQSMDELRQLFATQMKPANRARRWFRLHRRLTELAAVMACAAMLAVGGWFGTRDPFPIREYRQGQVAYERGDYAAAERHLSSALEADPHFKDARFLRACTHFHRESYFGAYSDFEPLMREFPGGRATAGLAHALVALRADFPQAAVIYRQAVDEGYKTAIAYNNLAHCLTKVGRNREAAEVLQLALKIDPNLSAAHQNLARAEFGLALQQRRAPDTTAIETALRLGPETGELDIDAATSYAVCARYATGKQQAMIFDRIFVLLERAAARGIVPGNLIGVASLNRTLESDARWAQVHAKMRPGDSFDRSVLLLDPLPELLAPASAAPSSLARR